MWPFTRKKKETKETEPIDLKSVTPGEVTATFLVGQPVFNTWNITTAINEGFKGNSYVFACIQKLMDASSSVPLKAQKEVEPEIWEDDPNSALQGLIDEPNPFQTWHTLSELFTSHLYLGGNAYLSKVKANNITVELSILPPDKVQVYAGRDVLVQKYVYHRGDKDITILPEDMIHLMFPDPGSLFLGVSPLQAGARIVDTDIEATKWNKVALQNRAVPDGILSFKDKLSRNQWQDARTRFDEQQTGADLNARKTLILGGDAVYKAMARTMIDMDFFKGRGFNREEICALFGVPPPIIGIYDKATLANIETARKIFWLDTIIPYLTGLMDAFNFALTPDFGEGIRLFYDTSKVEALQSILKEKIESAKILWSMGVPFNVINQRLDLGFDEVEGGDTPWIAINLAPAGASSGEGIDE